MSRRVALWLLAGAALLAVPTVLAQFGAFFESHHHYEQGVAVGGGVVAVVTVTTIATLTPPRPRDPYTGGELVVNDGRWPDVPPGFAWWPWDGGGWKSPADIERIIREREAAGKKANEDAAKEKEWTDREEDYNRRKRQEFEDDSWKATQKIGDNRRAEADAERVAREAEEQADRNRRRRQELEEQQERNRDEFEHAGDWQKIKDDFWDKTTKEIDELPGDIQKLGRDAVRGGFKAAEAVAKGLADPENWRIAGDTLAGTAWDAATGPGKLIAGDPKTWDNVVNAVDTVGKVGGHVVNEIKKDPVEFVKGLTPIKAWEEAMDPNKPLIERIGRTWWATIDTALTVDGIGKAIGKAGGKAVQSVSDDAVNAARRAFDDKRLPPKVDADELKRLNEAWERERAAARKKVFDYETKTRELDDAIKAGKQADIDRAIQAKRDAAIKLQGDKVSLQEINKAKPSTIKGFNRDMKTVYGNTDDRMVDWAAKEKGWGPMKAEGVNSDGARVFRDGKGNEIHIAEPTNPSTKIKAGADRDYTMRTRAAGDGDKLPPGLEGPARPKPLVDIPADKVQTKYNDEFFKAAGGKDMAKRTGLPDDPNAFGKKLDQVATDQRHAEAYGAGKRDLETALTRPDRAFSDPAQVGKAIEYKGDHWFKDGNVFEGSRQTVKQFDNQALGRFQAMDKHVEALQAEGKLAQDFVVKPPNPQLSQGIDIMRKVHEPNGISPAQAVEDLRKIGMTPEDVSRGVGDYVDTLQRAAPPVLRQRMGAP